MSAEDVPLHALVPTIVSLRRIEAGEFVMLDYGGACCRRCTLPVVLTQSSIIDLTQHMRFKASQPTTPTQAIEQ